MSSKGNRQVLADGNTYRKMTEDERLTFVGQCLKREVSRMSRTDPALCVWPNEIAIATAALTAPVRCQHKAFRGGSGARGNSGWVYVVDAPGSGFVKIGYSGSQWLDRRVRDVQSQNALKLKLIAVARGGTNLESHWHQQFKSYRRHLEWFESTEIVPLFTRAMADAPADGCARCVLMGDRLP